MNSQKGGNFMWKNNNNNNYYEIIITIIVIYMKDIMSTFWARVAGTSNFK